MVGKKKRQQHGYFNTMFVLGKAKAEQTKGRDKTMLQKKMEYWQEVSDE